MKPKKLKMLEGLGREIVCDCGSREWHGPLAYSFDEFACHHCGAIYKKGHKTWRRADAQTMADWKRAAEREDQERKR